MSTFVFLLLLIRDIFLQSPQDTKVIGSLLSNNDGDAEDDI